MQFVKLEWELEMSFRGTGKVGERHQFIAKRGTYAEREVVVDPGVVLANRVRKHRWADYPGFLTTDSFQDT